MEHTRISDTDLSKVHRFASVISVQPHKITPVLMGFCDKEITKSVYAAKKKLAKRGIFVLVNLTRQQRYILTRAREKYGNECVWSKSRVNFRPPSQ